MHSQDFIHYDIADMVMEKPLSFTVGNKYFDIYPVTLGKSYLLQRLIDSLEINKDNIGVNPFLEVLRLCRDKKDTVLRVIAYSVLKKKKDLFDEKKISKLISIFREEVEDEDLAKVLLYILTCDKVENCIKHFGIDKERQEQQRVLKVKNKGANILNFGGNSIYGTLIDAACERYGWTMEYVVWGISYANLRMLLADMSTTITMTDEEMRKARIVNKGNIVNGDDPANIERIKAMFPD